MDSATLNKRDKIYWINKVILIIYIRVILWHSVEKSHVVNEVTEKKEKENKLKSMQMRNHNDDA